MLEHHTFVQMFLTSTFIVNSVIKEMSNTEMCVNYSVRGQYRLGDIDVCMNAQNIYILLNNRYIWINDGSHQPYKTQELFRLTTSWRIRKLVMAFKREKKHSLLSDISSQTQRYVPEWV